VFLTKTAKVNLCQNPGVGRFDSRRWWTVLPLIPFYRFHNKSMAAACVNFRFLSSPLDLCVFYSNPYRRPRRE
jgi:hypothetical protein